MKKLTFVFVLKQRPRQYAMNKRLAVFSGLVLCVILTALFARSFRSTDRDSAMLVNQIKVLLLPQKTQTRHAARFKLRMLVSIACHFSELGRELHRAG